MQLNDYKPIFRERMLDLAWRQWVTLGLKGYGKAWKSAPVDLEALIVFTCEVGRWDPRLFDGMMEWVGINARWINVSRMRRMLTLSGVVPPELFLAMVERSDSSLLPKFKTARQSVTLPEETMSLFFGRDDQPLPTGRSLDPVFEKWGFLRADYDRRGICGPFSDQGAETLQLRLRALWGLNARAELLMHLLLGGENSSRAVARFCGYSAPSIAKALAEMAESGCVESYTEGRRVLYSLKDRKAWWTLLVGWPGVPKPVDWFAILPALTRLHIHLGEIPRGEVSPRQQASRLRRLLELKTFDGLNQVAPELRINGSRLPSGEELIPSFIQQVDAILDRLMEGQK